MASRAVLSAWASGLSGLNVSTQPEKLCANGVLYATLLDTIKPGLINLDKLNKGPTTEMSVQQNYKVLSAALEKAGVDKPIDSQALSKAQPAATMKMLQTIYALSEGASATTCKLVTLDANAIDSRVAGGKRKAPLPPSGSGGDTASGKRNSKAETVMTNASNAADNEVVAQPEPTPLEAVLRRQLDEIRTELARSKLAQQHGAEEVAFYISKLERIEDACHVCAPEVLGAAVLKLLNAEEGERLSMPTRAQT